VAPIGGGAVSARTVDAERCPQQTGQNLHSQRPV
jgi:hypothetical protein